MECAVEMSRIFTTTKVGARRAWQDLATALIKGEIYVYVVERH